MSCALLWTNVIQIFINEAVVSSRDKSNHGSITTGSVWLIWVTRDNFCCVLRLVIDASDKNQLFVVYTDHMKELEVLY